MPSLPTHVEVGRVGRPHGVRGVVLVRPLSDVVERFESGSELEAVDPMGKRRALRVAAADPHGDTLRVAFEGVTSRDEAEQLRGCSLEVSRTSTPPAPQGSFYYFELIGCRCVDRTAGVLGTVSEVIEDGGGLLLEVTDGTRSVAIPFVQAFVGTIDVAARRIELDLPEGLVETCAST